MSRSCVFALALCGLALIYKLPHTDAQALATTFEYTLQCLWSRDDWLTIALWTASPAASESRSCWEALGGLYALLAQHALGGHALARKSVRSPSRRLRFGRRSDPDMSPQAPLEMDDIMGLRDIRTPLRLRFGRRSDEGSSQKVEDEEMSTRSLRTPRLRFGRRSDDSAMDDDEMALRSIRTPRLRFGRRSDDQMFESDAVRETRTPRLRFGRRSDIEAEEMSQRDVRAPLRLRFGRSDESIAHVLPQKINEIDEDMALRDIRTPLRLRFGRSEERAVPHTFPQEEQDRAVRAPSMRLRFGRRSDNSMLGIPYESTVPKEAKTNSSTEDERQQE